jgi:hypothetical protein
LLLLFRFGNESRDQLLVSRDKNVVTRLNLFDQLSEVNLSLF